MQASLDQYLESYNIRRPHQGRGMNGRTPLTASADSIPKAKQKEKNTTRNTEPKPQTNAAA